MLQSPKEKGKPKFPEEVNEEPSLADLTKDFWYFFRLLNIETDFLQNDVKDWSLDIEYLKRKKRANMITVVNDCSERGIKSSATDFQSSATF